MMLLVVTSMRFVSVVVAAGNCDRSCQTRDCSRVIPSRGTAHANRERLCLVVAGADLSGANSSPYGPLHPTRRAAGFDLHQATASTATFELAQTGGISSCTGLKDVGSSDRTTLPNLGGLCLLLFSNYNSHGLGGWGDCLSPHSFLSPRLALKR